MHFPASRSRQPESRRAPTARMSARVLVADSNPLTREPLALALRAEGFRVTELAWRADLLDYLGEPLRACAPRELPGVIVARWEMFCTPGGPEILARARSELEVPLILIASSLAPGERAWFRTLGVSDVCEEGALGSIRAAVRRLASTTRGSPLT